MPSQRKKILFIVTQSEFGGAQRFLFEFATHLDPVKYGVSVAAGKHPGDLLDALRAKNIQTRPLMHLGREVSLWKDLSAFLEIKDLIRTERPDVLFLLSSKAGFLGSIAGRVSGTKRIVYRIGGWAFNDPRSWLGNRLYMLAEKLSARWKDVIITNSAHDAREALRLGIKPREKLVTVYNGLDPASLNFLSREEARRKLGIKNQESEIRVIGTIANFYKTKGLLYLIDAFADVVKKHPETRLVLIGDGRERREVEERITRRGASKQVLLAGHILDAARYVKACDVFVLPSLKEGFPWVMLEVMAAEVPIIATRVGAVPEIIAHDESGLLVEPGDAKELAGAIQKLLGGEALRKNFAGAARHTLIDTFPLARMLRGIEQLL